MSAVEQDGGGGVVRVKDLSFIGMQRETDKVTEKMQTHTENV